MCERNVLDATILTPTVKLFKEVKRLSIQSRISYRRKKYAIQIIAYTADIYDLL